MHIESYQKIQAFVDTYLNAHHTTPLEIVDFGSQQVDENHLTYRTLLMGPSWHYRGLDIVEGRNVDVVATNTYTWSEIENDTVDLVVSGQALEHVEFFWVSIFEMGRILRPGGVAVLVAPSGGYEHRFPVDCWRFYTDGVAALAEYLQFDLLDAFTDWQRGDWRDSIVVMRKPIWGNEQRDRFLLRAWHQQATLDPDIPKPTLGTPAVPASPLATLQPGLLAPMLEAMRTHDPRVRLRTMATRLSQPVRKVESRVYRRIWYRQRSRAAQRR